MKIKIQNISKIFTWDKEKNHLNILLNKEILIEGEKIIQIDDSIQSDYIDKVIDARGCIITPGFIDSHTHPIFIGNRADEFKMRLEGKSY